MSEEIYYEPRTESRYRIPLEKSVLAERFDPHIGVLERFAKAFYLNTALKKTHLHLISRIKWNSFLQYLNWLIMNQYVVLQEDGSYLLTENGREMFEKLSAFLVYTRSKDKTLLSLHL